MAISPSFATAVIVSAVSGRGGVEKMDLLKVGERVRLPKVRLARRASATPHVQRIVLYIHIQYSGQLLTLTSGTIGAKFVMSNNKAGAVKGLPSP